MKAADLSYRPATYWPSAPTVEQLLSRIKGQARRDQARAIMESEGFSGLSTFIAQQSLSEDDRARWGSIHPSLMGGEYLPGLEDNQVEIARISLKSTTGDQISVRATRVEGAIHYSVMDEYETEYILPNSETMEPLTLGELVALLDETNHPDEGQENFDGLVKSHWNFVGNEDARPYGLLNAIGFVRVESGFYPGLSAHYAQEAHKWLTNRIAAYDADYYETIDSDDLAAVFRRGDAYTSLDNDFGAQLIGLYMTGKGAPLDIGQAVFWAQQAADAGHSLGQTLLGFAFAAGNGVPQDYVEAYKWFNLASQRCPQGQTNEDAERCDALARLMTAAQVVEAERRAQEWQTTFENRGR